jgi:hypothetical protein
MDSGYRVDGRNACMRGVFPGERGADNARKACNDQITFPVFAMRCCVVLGLAATSVFSS